MEFCASLSETFDLPENELHVWAVSLVQPAKVLRKLAGFLDETEISKVARFKFENDKERYIVAHGATRRILARYLKSRPQNIVFENNHYGKPFLAENTSRIEFNLAHSKNRALLALTRDRRVGVDIEHIRPEIPTANLAEHYFSARENEVLRNLDENLQIRAFYDCWTRKEAFIKAIGMGLSFPLRKFAVSIESGNPARLLFVDDSNTQAERWKMIDLNLGVNYSAAVIIESALVKLKLLNWNYYDC